MWAVSLHRLSVYLNILAPGEFVLTLCLASVYVKSNFLPTPK